MIISPVTAMIIADMTGRQEMSLLDDWVRQNAHTRRIIKFRSTLQTNCNCSLVNQQRLNKNTNL